MAAAVVGPPSRRLTKCDCFVAEVQPGFNGVC